MDPDEELGEGIDHGLSWLCREHPEAVRCDYAVNEGAGDRVEIGGRVLYLCSSAEKRSSPFVLHVRGRSGHGSMPGIAMKALMWVGCKVSISADSLSATTSALPTSSRSATRARPGSSGAGISFRNAPSSSPY